MKNTNFAPQQVYGYIKSRCAEGKPASMTLKEIGLALREKRRGRIADTEVARMVTTVRRSVQDLEKEGKISVTRNGYPHAYSVVAPSKAIAKKNDNPKDNQEVKQALTTIINACEVLAKHI